MKSPFNFQISEHSDISLNINRKYVGYFIPSLYLRYNYNYSHTNPHLTNAFKYFPIISLYKFTHAIICENLRHFMLKHINFGLIVKHHSVILLFWINSDCR